MTAASLFGRSHEVTTAEQARDLAIDWQHWQSERSMSYAESALWIDLFEQLGERFGLTEEFRENGIIGDPP